MNDLIGKRVKIIKAPNCFGFDEGRVGRAIEFRQKGKHQGKIVVRLGSSSGSYLVYAPPEDLQVEPELKSVTKKQKKEIRTEYTQEEWTARAKELFGEDALKWKFQCPSCGSVKTAEDFRKYKDMGATPNSAYQECIGRYTGGRKGLNKCDWASYGLFCGPVFVMPSDGGKRIPVFDFAQ